MNVLYLTINPNRQSTAVPTEGWFRCLSSRGLRPVLVSHQWGEFQDWAAGEGIPAYHVPLVSPSKTNPLPFLKSLWRLRNVVREHRIDLIHCNEQDCYPIGSYLARVSRLPVVVSVHFTMGREYCEWAFGGRRCPDRMIFISRGNLEACREGVEGVVPADRWRLLYNGLDLQRYLPDADRRARFRSMQGVGVEVAVGVACALRPRKQLEHLFLAVQALGESAPHVFVAGAATPGDEAYAEQLLADGKRRLGARLHVLGHLEELRDFYNGMDIFVNTSQEEACSISVMESLACGCPVLGYPSKSVDDQILPHGGEIVAQDDVERLARQLRIWIADRTVLAARRESARRQAERFDICRISDQLWSEYEELLSARKFGRRISATEPRIQARCAGAN